MPQMIGGPPMMSPPQFAPQQYSMPGQPMQPYNVPAAMASAAPARQAPSSQPMTAAPPRPVVRAQAADDPVRPAPPVAAPVVERPALLNMPAPEQLGVAAAGVVDWGAAHARLEKLGTTCFHEEKLPGGACRVTCVLPNSNGKQEHRVEAEATNEAEAVQVVLAEAERWSARK